jgi:hypothetical protein
MAEASQYAATGDRHAGAARLPTTATGRPPALAAASCRDRYACASVKQWPDAQACRRRGDDRAARAPLGGFDRRLGAAHPRRGLAVVLTGTDLYRDIATDAAAQRSLALAQALVVLQELGAAGAARARCVASARVIFQSTTARQDADQVDALSCGR